jgi:importin-4
LHFIKYIDYIITNNPYILQKKTKTGAERSMAIGCLGEVIGGIKGGVTPHTEQLLTLFLKAAADQEEEVRSNAAYALGVLSAYTQYDVSRYEA